MTSIERKLGEMASDAAESARRRAASLQAELDDAENLIATLRSALAPEQQVLDRLQGYEPIIGSELQCPHCWVLRGTEAIMRLTKAGMPADRFRCETCATEVLI